MTLKSRSMTFVRYKNALVILQRRAYKFHDQFIEKSCVLNVAF